MKSVASSYSASFVITQTSPAIRERILALVPTFPNYVWLTMLLLAASLLALSTLARSRGQLQTAQNAHTSSQTRLSQAQATNMELKSQTVQLRTSNRVAANSAQAQLHYVKANEVVIATP